MAFEVTRQELLKQANDLLQRYNKTRDPELKAQEVRIRKIIVDLDYIATTGSQNLQQTTDLGSTTTNSITASAFIKSGGTAAQFLKADGSVDNNVYLTATSFKYGAFYDNTIQNITLAFQEKTVEINTTSYSNGVTLGANQLVFSTAGTYDIQISLQVTNTHNQDQDFYLWFAHNSVNIPDTTSIVTVPSTHGGINGHYILSMNLFYQVNAGDNIELRWTANHIGVQIETVTPGFGTLPDAPSVIVTATQV